MLSQHFLGKIFTNCLNIVTKYSKNMSTFKQHTSTSAVAESSWSSNTTFRSKITFRISVFHVNSSSLNMDKHYHNNELPTV